MEHEILNKLEAIERYTLLAAKNVLCFDDVALLTGFSKSHLYKLTCSHHTTSPTANKYTLIVQRLRHG